jgi:uncharacterized protein (DUF952 family)
MADRRRLYHITTAREAEEAKQCGTYVPTGFEREGFIHCSYGHQVLATANRIFRGRRDLVVLEIDSATIDCAVVDENLEGGTQLFPHIYGHLKMSAVVGVHDFPCDADGGFSRPLSD